MKHEKISIKWKIFIYMLTFSAVLLCLLWFVQTVYLDRFYKKIKMNELENAMKNVVNIIDQEDVKDELSNISDRYDLCILVADSEGRKQYSVEKAINCSVHKYDASRLRELYREAEENGGTLEFYSKRDGEGFSDNNSRSDEKPEKKPDNKPEKITDEKSDEKSDEKPENHPDEQLDEEPEETLDDQQNEETEKKPGEMKDNSDNSPVQPEKKNWQKKNQERLGNLPESTKSMIKVKTITTQSGEKLLILIDSVITPVDATVGTLRVQLIYISLIMVALSLVIAFVMSKRVSRSMIAINESAKELAKGNFEVEFTGKDYKEIAELSETLNYATKELSKSDLLQKELLANVSHDLRTPLTMITAYAEVMRDLPGENTPENVQVIIDEANRLTQLVNDLLDISKIQAGVSVLETKDYDITESIQSIIERHSKLLEPYGYQISFLYDRNVIVNADEFKIYQVIYNLIANAVNYAGEDRKIEVKQSLGDGCVRIEVIDHGQGIPEEQLENVWQRYYKIDKNHKRAIVGSGLGLNIVKNILVMHQAKFGVESEAGEGCRFWFELPLSQ